MNEWFSSTKICEVFAPAPKLCELERWKLGRILPALLQLQLKSNLILHNWLRSCGALEWGVDKRPYLGEIVPRGSVINAATHSIKKLNKLIFSTSFRLGAYSVYMKFGKLGKI